MVSQEITLDQRFHPRLIGQKGRNLKKIQDEFNVTINLPRSADPNPNLVVVTGIKENDVEDCCSKLRQMEEDFMEDYIDRNQYISARYEPEPQQPASRPFEIQGAPWQLDNNQFPDLGGGASAAPAPSAAASSTHRGVWGSRR